MHTAWIQHVHLISVPHNIESAMCWGEEREPTTFHLLASTRCSGLWQQVWQAIPNEALRRLAMSARHDAWTASTPTAVTRASGFVQV